MQFQEKMLLRFTDLQCHVLFSAALELKFFEPSQESNQQYRQPSRAKKISLSRARLVGTTNYLFRSKQRMPAKSQKQTNKTKTNWFFVTPSTALFGGCFSLYSLVQKIFVVHNYKSGPSETWEPDAGGEIAPPDFGTSSKCLGFLHGPPDFQTFRRLYIRSFEGEKGSFFQPINRAAGPKWTHVRWRQRFPGPPGVAY